MLYIGCMFCLVLVFFLSCGWFGLVGVRCDMKGRFSGFMNVVW